ncbi:MAG: hypothetical protein ABL973_08550 [Micropepsaceae bacterium]
MNKLPVFSTVSRTFGFLLGDIITIIRISWLPFLIASGLSSYVGADAFDAMIAAKENPARAMEMAQVNFLIGIAGFVANIVVIVALLRVVMFGDRKPGLPAYIWFGMTETRLIVVYLLLIVAAMAGVIGASIGFGIFAAIVAAVPGLEAVIGIAAAALMIAAIWAVVKLSIIPAVVVAEKGLGVERSWALMKGNAFRMFLVLLFIFIPVACLNLVVVLAILGSDLPTLPDFKALLMSGGQASAEALRVAAETWQVDMMKAMRAHWVEFMVLNYISSIISAALTAGVAGNAYLALAGEPAHE